MNKYQKAFHECKDGVGIVQMHGYTFVFIGHGWKVFAAGTGDYVTFVPHGDDTNTFEELYDDLEDVLRMESMREMGAPTAVAVFNIH